MNHEEDYKFFRVMEKVRRELQDVVRTYSSNDTFHDNYMQVSALMHRLSDAYMDDMGQVIREPEIETMEIK